MKLVRIDRIAPGGAALDLHPRMTVLADAPPELRRRLVEVFRSFAQDTAPGHPGLLEVSGVRLTLDRATLDQLQLDPLVDAVLRFGGPGAADPALGDPVGGVAGGPTSDLLRRRLRDVAARRTQLAERMEQHRNDLDPHAGTAVEVGLGQIEALEFATLHAAGRVGAGADPATRAPRRVTCPTGVAARLDRAGRSTRRGGGPGRPRRPRAGDRTADRARPRGRPPRRPPRRAARRGPRARRTTHHAAAARARGHPASRRSRRGRPHRRTCHALRLGRPRRGGSPGAGARRDLLGG